jgi:hypothetical protein
LLFGVEIPDSLKDGDSGRALPGIPHARKYKYVGRDKTIVRPEWACITLAEYGRFTHSQNR